MTARCEFLGTTVEFFFYSIGMLRVHLQHSFEIIALLLQDLRKIVGVLGRYLQHHLQILFFLLKFGNTLT